MKIKRVTRSTKSHPLRGYGKTMVQRKEEKPKPSVHMSQMKTRHYTGIQCSSIPPEIKTPTWNAHDIIQAVVGAYTHQIACSLGAGNYCQCERWCGSWFTIATRLCTVDKSQTYVPESIPEAGPWLRVDENYFKWSLVSCRKRVDIQSILFQLGNGAFEVDLL